MLGRLIGRMLKKKGEMETHIYIVLATEVATATGGQKIEEWQADGCYQQCNLGTGENGSSKNEQKESRVSYSVETPYGFHLDLDFLKYVHDIEKGNTIKRIHIHRRAKQSKFSTLPRNFSVPDNGSQSYSASASNTWGPSSYRAGPRDSEMLSGRESPLRLRYVHELNYRRRDNLYDAQKPLGELVPEDFSGCRPHFSRASSLPASLPQSTTFLDQNQSLKPPQPANSFSDSRLEFMDEPISAQHSSEQIAAAFKRIKDLEEQLKTIPELKQTIFTLEEENGKLNVQLESLSQLINNQKEQETIEAAISEGNTKAEGVENGVHDAHDQSDIDVVSNSLLADMNQQVVELREQLDDRAQEVQNLRILVEKQSNELKAKDVYIGDLTRMMEMTEETRRHVAEKQYRDAAMNTENVQSEVHKETSDKNTYANISVETRSMGCGVLPIDLDQRPDEPSDPTATSDPSGETLRPLTDTNVQLERELVNGESERSLEGKTEGETKACQAQALQRCDNPDCNQGLVDNKHCPADRQPPTDASIGQYVKRIQDLLQEQWTCLEHGYPDLASAIKQPASKLSSIQTQLVNSLNLLSSVYSTQPTPEPETVKADDQQGEASPRGSLKSIMKKKTNSGRSGASSELRTKKNLQFVGVNGGYETTSSEDSSSSDEEEYSDGEKTEKGDPAQDIESDERNILLNAETRVAEVETPQLSDTETPQSQQRRCSVGDTFRSECQILNNHLSEIRTTMDNRLRQSLYTVCQEWFRVSSQKSSSPGLVSIYLDELKSISPQLLQMVVNMADENGNTSLHYSVSHSNFVIVNLLLDTGVCDVDHQNKAGYTPVMLTALASAESDEDLDVVKALLSLGNVNLTASQGGQTALMLAVGHGRSDMVKVLLDFGADVNLQDDDGESALMMACQLGNLETVKLILSHPDCDPEITDKAGNSALSIVAESAHSEIAELLQAHTEHQSSCPATDTGKGGPFLKPRSKSFPPLSSNRYTSLFLQAVQRDLQKVSWRVPKDGDNLSELERSALKDLQRAPKVIVRPSDKGGNVVLLDRDYYIAEIMKQLNDHTTYRKVDFNPFPQVVMRLNDKLDWAKEEGLLTPKLFEFLRVRDYNTPVLYTLPKIHKSPSMPPGISTTRSYACLHLGKWEEVFGRAEFGAQVALWLRYIDDILVVWRGTPEAFESFVTLLNHNGRNIRLTSKIGPNELEFLDLMIRREGDRLLTMTFRKPTTGNTPFY
ncbi:KN motif and ankyrin repeat domain-containing protein 4 [Gastrophryne carolinensis]